LVLTICVGVAAVAGAVAGEAGETLGAVTPSHRPTREAVTRMAMFCRRALR